MKIEIYTTGTCAYCERAKQLLSHKGVRYQEIRIDQDLKKQAEMISRTKGLRSVPQIFINDKHIGGFDDLHALDKAGKLDELLD